MSTATGEFAQTVTDLSTSDVGSQLVGSFSGLADVEQKAQELQSTQSHEDVATLMATGVYPSAVYQFYGLCHTELSPSGRVCPADQLRPRVYLCSAVHGNSSLTFGDDAACVQLANPDVPHVAVGRRSPSASEADARDEPRDRPTTV